jgi:hypothetical protein
MNHSSIRRNISVFQIATLHHSPHHGAAADGTTFTWAMGLLLVIWLFGLHGKSPPF